MSDIIIDTVLVVDDNEDNRILLKRRLEKRGFWVDMAENGRQALEKLDGKSYDLLLLDIMMPEMNGYQVLEILKNNPQHKNLPVIVISGIGDMSSVVKCIELGAEDYLTKPFDATLLKARIGACIEKKHLRDQDEKHRQQIEEYNLHLEQRVREKVKEVSAAQMAVIYAMAKMAEFRDMETGKHLERVSEYCRIITQELLLANKYTTLLTPIYIENIFNASPLHDIGKVGIQDQILLKPGKLTPFEFDAMKKHTIIGKDILNAVNEEYPGNGLIEVGMEISISHHEKWDGSGYPYGLWGDNIPLSGRILALVDVYDALISKRVYKEAMSHVQACALILEGRACHFDPIIVDCFLNRIHDFQYVHERIDS